MNKEREMEPLEVIPRASNHIILKSGDLEVKIILILKTLQSGE